MTDKELEFQTLLIPLDDKYQEKINELTSQGWSIIAGTAPFAVFNLCRPVQHEDVPFLRAKVDIDEAGVTIVKGNSN